MFCIMLFLVFLCSCVLCTTLVVNKEITVKVRKSGLNYLIMIIQIDLTAFVITSAEEVNLFISMSVGPR